jgi:hypothetical protein
MEILSSMTRNIIFEVIHINANDTKGVIAPDIVLMDDMIREKGFKPKMIWSYSFAYTLIIMEVNDMKSKTV